MITETDLRDALRSRACATRSFDADEVLRSVHASEAGSSVSQTSPNRARQWVLTGVVAAGVVAAAATPVVLLSQSNSHRQQPGSLSAGTGTNTSAASAPRTRPTVSATRSAGTFVAPVKTPVPADQNWIDSRTDPNMVVDPAAIVFSADPIIGYYQRPHQQLSILPAGATAKDSSDAKWHTAVQVYLRGSGFDPGQVENSPTVTVNGVVRYVSEQPRVLAVTGAARVPSLVWPVGQAWVVLQIDNPARPSTAELSAAAERMDVHPG